MNKEHVYDTEINPLMAQVIAICKKHKIAVLASFSLDEDEEGGFVMCTTALFDETNSPPAIRMAHDAILGRRGGMMKLTTKDAAGNIIAQEIIA